MIRSITLALSAVILLSSCAGKFSLLKRKYTKGFYVSSSKGRHTKNRNTDHEKVALHQKAVKPLETSPLAEVVKVTPQEFAPLIKTQALNTPKTAPVEVKTGKDLLAQAASVPVTEPITHKAKSVKPLDLSKQHIVLNSKDDDAMFIVLVILCFFWWLNLISVYIHDKHQVTTNFWVTLLLNLTFIGGIIFSLLVVLDVVDLNK